VTISFPYRATRNFFMILGASYSARTRPYRTGRNDAREGLHPGKSKPSRFLHPKHIFVAVHHLDDSVYYKRLMAAGYRVLCGLRDGKTLEAACAGIEEGDAGKVKETVEAAARMGWLVWRMK
jgi:hypothetical protein